MEPPATRTTRADGAEDLHLLLSQQADVKTLIPCVEAFFLSGKSLKDHIGLTEAFKKRAKISPQLILDVILTAPNEEAKDKVILTALKVLWKRGEQREIGDIVLYSIESDRIRDKLLTLYDDAPVEKGKVKSIFENDWDEAISQLKRLIQETPEQSQKEALLKHVIHRTEWFHDGFQDLQHCLEKDSCSPELKQLVADYMWAHFIFKESAKLEEINLQGEKRFWLKLVQVAKNNNLDKFTVFISELIKGLKILGYDYNEDSFLEEMRDPSKQKELNNRILEWSRVSKTSQFAQQELLDPAQSTEEWPSASNSSQLNLQNRESALVQLRDLVFKAVVDENFRKAYYRQIAMLLENENQHTQTIYQLLEEMQLLKDYFTCISPRIGTK